MNVLILFWVSLACISLELFFTRILNLKTWNHVVYIIIPFAILGYGVGANVCLLARPALKKMDEKKLLFWALLFTGFTAVVCTYILIHLPVKIGYLSSVLTSLDSILMLLLSYTVMMVPFVAVGFIVVYLFQSYPAQSSRFYFFDLVGAGMGALIFYVLINYFQVFHSVVLLSLVLVFHGLLLLLKRKSIALLFIILCSAVLFVFPEPVRYVIDPAKGWEWIPGYFRKHQYEHTLSRWHPMGRTDIFRIFDRNLIENFFLKSGKIQSTYDPSEASYVSAGTFEINLTPPPELAYISTNFLAGTPIYRFSGTGLAEYHSKLDLFSQPMEVPYVLLNEPRMVIIGTGGGRDIFMAKTHGAKEVFGAEINPATYSVMSEEGEFYEYSGGIYGQEGVRVFNMDGRHLVKNLEKNTFDLVVLNGVDTYSGLSTGAYAYAESYLYTKNAIKDYFALLGKDGIINFNRWFFPEMPRENLRLFVNIIEALQEEGIEAPWEHIMIGNDRSWAMTLIKRSPFTDEERRKVEDYFSTHSTELIFPVDTDLAQQKNATKVFALYVKSLKEGRAQEYIEGYPFDISIVTDDKPFFYKHFKLKNFNPFDLFKSNDVGPIMFLTQLLILFQASVFVALFILLPLVIFKKQGIKELPGRFKKAFIVYFSCLGAGFMLIEIPIMQRFTLLLGSPIYSISVTLVALLISAGLGSFLLPWLRKFVRSTNTLILIVTVLMTIYIIPFILNLDIFDQFMHHDFGMRVLIVILAIMPLGIMLGMYFPAGLQLIGSRHEETIPWAWGINSGFSVLGGILAIILAQLLGFSKVLMLAGLIYFLACYSFNQMYRAMEN